MDKSCNLMWIREEPRNTASGHFTRHYPWYSLITGSSPIWVYYICSHPNIIFFLTYYRFTELFCSAIFLPDLGECNNSNYSVLLYKVTVREACQGTIFPDRCLICHSYCCGYCMTVHVLSSCSLLTFMFHLISLLFLGVYDIKILSCCLFKCGASCREFSGLSSASDGVGKGSTRVHTCKKRLRQHPNTNSCFSLCFFFFLASFCGDSSATTNSFCSLT